MTEYTLTVKIVRLSPLTVSIQTYKDSSYDNIISLLYKYVSSLEDVKNVNLKTKLKHALIKATKTELPAIIYSHPENGVILRHIFTITKTAPCYLLNGQMDLDI